MKKTYEKPVIEIEIFEIEDIITGSGLTSVTDGSGDVLSWDDI